MTWSKLDDRFHEHPKILGLSHAEFRLYVCGITYSSAHLTDGFIAEVAAQALCRQHRVPQPAIQGLVAKGCWAADESAGGYRVHDYADYQRVSSRAAELSAARSEAGRRGAAARWQTGSPAMANRRQTDGKPEWQTDAPVPVPVPYGDKATSGDITETHGDESTHASPHAGGALVLVSDEGGARAPAERVFEAWKRETGRTGRTVLNAQRQRLLRRALTDYDEADLLDAMRGWRHDPWPDRPQHTELEVLLRPANLEKFRDWERNGPPLIPMPAAHSQSAFYRQEAERLRKKEAAEQAALNGSHPPAVDVAFLKSAGGYEEEDQP